MMKIYFNFIEIYFFFPRRFKYQVIAHEGMGIPTITDPEKTKLLQVKGAPVFLEPNFFGGPEVSGKIFSIGVRIVSSDGIPSDLMDYEAIEVQPDSWYASIVQPSMSPWVVILPIIVIGFLVGAAFYLFQRRRRSQTSFSRFANSHYDTKTGATRIGDAIDEDDHQETPPRFADDEPLVIT